MRTLIGVGHLSWESSERISDRYGTCNLFDTPTEDHVLFGPEVDALEGHKGKLIAEVIEPVHSHHIGDLFRGLFPTFPDVGEVVELGTGTLFVEHRGRPAYEKSSAQIESDQTIAAMASAFKKAGAVVHTSPNRAEVYDAVGLKPDDGRESDWLNPESLYRVHSSKVNLYFEPV